MAIAGRVAIVPKGDWSANATYKRLDAVTYNNTLYFAKKEVPAGTATSNTEYWSKSIVGGVGAIATKEDAGVVKPDGKSMSVDESGTLSINLDGTTITLDEAKNVIKLADALKDKIGTALQPESIANNRTTTEAGFALDARQANPDIDGTLAKQLSNAATKDEVKALNPANEIKLYARYGMGSLGEGWYRIAAVVYSSEVVAMGAAHTFIEISLLQYYNNGLGCFHKVKTILKYFDSAQITSLGLVILVLTKVRIVRKSNIIYIDVYSKNIDNGTCILLDIPMPLEVISAKVYDSARVVPETADGEKVVCSVDLKDNFAGA